MLGGEEQADLPPALPEQRRDPGAGRHARSDRDRRGRRTASSRWSGRAAPRTIGTFPEPFIKLTARRGPSSPRGRRSIRRTPTFIPDFARSSDIISRMWERRQPEHHRRRHLGRPGRPVLHAARHRPDDPGATAQQLTADNADEYLMRDVYLERARRRSAERDLRRRREASLRRPDQRQQRSRRLCSPGSVRRRPSVDSCSGQTASDEEERIADTAIAGLLPVEAQSPTRGGRLRERLRGGQAAATTSTTRWTWTARSCSAERQTLDVTVTMTSTVPKGVTLPPSVVGPPPPTRRARARCSNSIYLYAPAGGYIDSAAARRRGAGARGVHLPRARGRSAHRRPAARSDPHHRLHDPDGHGRDGRPAPHHHPRSARQRAGKVSASAC